MSQEVVEMMQEMDLEDVETQIALQCAPVIAGVKISNLLIVPDSKASQARKLLENTDILCKELLTTETQTTFLVYKQEKVERYLERKKVRNLLQQLGYNSWNINSLLEKIGEKYQSYMKHGGVFPHEMGLLLGYPAEDVTGFIEHKGKNFLYSGYWKVYKNLPAKKKLFCQYEQAKETILQLMCCGVSIIDIIDIYHEEPLQRAAG